MQFSQPLDPQRVTKHLGRRCAQCVSGHCFRLVIFFCIQTFKRSRPVFFQTSNFTKCPQYFFSRHISMSLRASIFYPNFFLGEGRVPSFFLGGRPPDKGARARSERRPHPLQPHVAHPAAHRRERLVGRCRGPSDIRTKTRNSPRWTVLDPSG